MNREAIIAGRKEGTTDEHRHGVYVGNRKSIPELGHELGQTVQVVAKEQMQLC